MASPDYQPIFKVKYNPVRGLAALLQGYNTGAQQKFVNQNTDRNAPIGENEMMRMASENYQKGLANQMAYSPIGQQMNGQDFWKAVQALQGSMRPTNIAPGSPSPTSYAVAPQGYDPSSGQPNPIDPVQQIQGLPGASLPQGAAQPAAPVKVSRGGYSAQDLIDYARKQGWAQ